MFYRLSALAVVLAIGAGGLVADEKAKKSSEGVRGTVANFDMSKKAITLKTDGGEKTYTASDNLRVVFEPGSIQFNVSLTASQDKPTLQASFKTGNDVELFLGKGDTVTQVHVYRHPGKANGTQPITKPMQKRGG
jgi:hypothetical protein